MFAFAIQDFVTKEIKEDPNFVEWVPRLIINDGITDLSIINLGFRKCTLDDWGKFYEPSRKSSNRFENMQKNS